MLESEFINKVEEIFGPVSPYRDFSVSLERHNPATGELTIRISQMYKFVDISFDQLARLSELTQTRKINLQERTSYGGCETCDHGSSYQVPIYLQEFWIPLEKDPVGSNKNKRRNKR